MTDATLSADSFDLDACILNARVADTKRLLEIGCADDDSKPDKGKADIVTLFQHAGHLAKTPETRDLALKAIVVADFRAAHHNFKDLSAEIQKTVQAVFVEPQPEPAQSFASKTREKLARYFAAPARNETPEEQGQGPLQHQQHFSSLADGTQYTF